jgi:hypothetical protein
VAGAVRAVGPCSEEPKVSDEGPAITTVRRDDGTWAVVRDEDGDGAVLSTHPRRAGAESEAFRLAQSGATDAEEAEAELTEEQGAHADQSGG